MPALWKKTLATVARLDQSRPSRHVDQASRQHLATLRRTGNRLHPDNEEGRVGACTAGPISGLSSEEMRNGR